VPYGFSALTLNEPASYTLVSSIRIEQTPVFGLKLVLILEEAGKT